MVPTTGVEPALTYHQSDFKSDASTISAMWACSYMTIWLAMWALNKTPWSWGARGRRTPRGRKLEPLRI